MRTNQSALAVPGNDRASTEGLFQYLDASILPAYLEPATLRWGGEPGGPVPATLATARSEVEARIAVVPPSG